MMTSGGPVAWMLIVLLLVAIVTFFVRWLDLRRAQIDYQDLLKGVINILDMGNDAEAIAVCEDVGAPAANVIATAIRHRNGSARVLREAVDSQGRAEISRLDRRLATLAIIGQVAPALGLLGTVIGFIKTLLLLNGQEVVSRAELMGGAMNALVSTAFGLMVAIPVIVMYGSLRVRLNRTVADLEAAASQIVGYISTAREDSRK